VTLHLHLPRPGEPETALAPGIAGVASHKSRGVARFLVGEGMPDTSMSGPVMLQQPPRWHHDFEPDTGNSRATLRSVIPVYENPPQVPTPPPGSSDTSTATTEFVSQACADATVDAVAKSRIGVTNGFNAAPGIIGEYLEQILNTPGVQLDTNRFANIINFALPPGDWDLYGTLGFNFNPPSDPSQIVQMIGGLSLQSASIDSRGGMGVASVAATPIFFDTILPVTLRVNTPAGIVVFLVSYAQFVPTVQVWSYGSVFARRRR
jgi:hypothetical protein